MRFMCCLNMDFLTILKMSPDLFVWHYTESVAAKTNHYVIVFILENVERVMTLWRRYDVLKFNVDAILFGEKRCKNNGLLCFCSVLCLLCFVCVCLYVLCGHLLGKGWPLGSRLWCLLWVCHFPIGILGQVWYLIVSIPDLCNLITLAVFSVGFWFELGKICKNNEHTGVFHCIKTCLVHREMFTNDV